MHFPRLLLVGVLLSGMAIRAESGWTSLWNGKDLDGWTTWMRQPEPGSSVPGLKRDADGKYTEPIGSGRDPLKVFTVDSDVDGRPAIRISGEVFGELRTKRTFKDYHLKLQFKWGEKKWPPRDKPDTRARQRSALPRARRARAQTDAPGRARLSCRSRSMTSAISTRSDRRSPSGRSRAPDTQPTLYDYDPAGEWTFFSQSQGASGRCIKQPDNEKPDRRVEHRRVDRVRRRRHSHRERQGGDAPSWPGANRRRPADARHLGPDHSPVGGGGSFLPRHPDPADHRDPGGVRSEVVDGRFIARRENRFRP